MSNRRAILSGLVLLAIGATVSADAQPLGRNTQTSSSCQIRNIKKGVGGQLWDLHAVYPLLSDRGHHRALRRGRAPLPVLPDDRTEGAYPERIPARAGEPHLRLR